MYTLPSICEVTRKHSRWHSHSRRHDPKNASLTPDWICASWFHFLVRNKEEVLREFLVMATAFSEHLDSTHWYARSSPELKKDNCPMWIESYIVSRYTCCLKQNNYIILLIMSYHWSDLASAHKGLSRKVQHHSWANTAQLQTAQLQHHTWQSCISKTLVYCTSDVTVTDKLAVCIYYITCTSGKLFN